VSVEKKNEEADKGEKKLWRPCYDTDF